MNEKRDDDEKNKKKKKKVEKWKSGRRNDGERCSMLTASIIYEQGSWFTNEKKRKHCV
jgi:hypothetical protein